MEQRGLFRRSERKYRLKVHTTRIKEVGNETNL